MDQIRGPVELVFYNIITKHFSVFNQRLVFDHSWYADMYITIQPKPPIGIQWLKMYAKTKTKLEKIKDDEYCVPFDHLMDEIYGNVKHGKNWELVLLHTKTDKLCTPYEEPAVFGTATHANNYTNFQPNPPEFEWMIIPFVQGENHPTVTSFIKQNKKNVK